MARPSPPPSGVLPHPQEEASDALNAMLRQFNEQTGKLESAYANLRTELHRLNAELEEKNTALQSRIAEVTEIKEYLNCVLDSVTNGVIAVDLAGRITAFNDGAARITGHDAGTALGCAYEELLGVPFGVDGRGHPAGQLAAEAEFVTSEVLDVHGRPVPVRESTAIMHDAAGNVLGAVKVFEDLSEIRELEARARQRDRLSALGEMAATVAHEIRNPLGGIEGFAALLARDVPEDDARRRLVDQILIGTRSLNRVVTELLLFTRPIRYQMQLLDLRDLLETTWAFVAAEAEAAQVTVERVYPEEPMHVRADPEQLRRALLNMMLNAVQAMTGGGTLRLGLAHRMLTDEDLGPYDTSVQREWVEIEVHDSGTGIPADVLDKIFNPFFTTKEKGTGLGLATALKIVEGHSGWLHAASDETGTTFSVYLPRPRERRVT